MDPPNDPYEGSGDHLVDHDREPETEGSGSCDDEDDEDCQNPESKTVPTIPSTYIPTSQDPRPKSVDQNIFQLKLLTAQITASGRAGLSGDLVALNANKVVEIEREERWSMKAFPIRFVVGAL